MIGHFIGGKEVAGTSGDMAMFNPNTGEVRANSPWPASRGRASHRIGHRGANGMGRHQSAASRAGDVQIS
jgi:hypothetical protein